ncbi:MAG TPA: serine hydrolase domain-containing protein [Phenylobacterium sp.]|nr:serine hydrolase domain-containing protein [Phenylobacterium sp.]
MNLHRRTLIATLAAAGLSPALAPAAAHAQWPFGLGRRRPQAPVEGRGPYMGAFRQQFGDWQFDQIRDAVSTRLQPVIRDGLETRFYAAARALTGASEVSAALAEPGGAVWTHDWRADAAASPATPGWDGLAEAYLGTALMQMVQAGQVSLDDPLYRWAPQEPQARWITVEDLLAHASGLPDAPPDPDGAPAPMAFPPGSAWGRNPRNTALLIQVLETVDEAAIDQILAARIAERRDLGQTSFASEPGGVTVAAPALEVVRFGRDLLGDRLHGAAETRRRFYRLYGQPDVAGAYSGLAVQVADLAADEAQASDTWLGAWGPDDRSVLAYSMTTRATVAVAVRGQGSAASVARALLNAVTPA